MSLLTTIDQCELCEAQNWLHHLDCPQPLQTISELDEPQEFKVVKKDGNFFKIQPILTLDCHRCGNLRTFIKIISSKETKQIGMGFKNGEIIYKCWYCDLLGVVQLSNKTYKQIQHALVFEKSRPKHIQPNVEDEK